MVEIDRVQQHLQALGFKPNDVIPFTKRLASWIENSGVEWTTLRLKSLKQFHLQQLSGVVPTIPDGWAVYQTRTRKVFKDPFVRKVMDLPNTGVSLLRKEGFIRMYQVFKLDTLTERQLSGFIENVTAPYSGTDEGLQEAIKLTSVGIRQIIRECRSLGDLSKVDFTPLRLTAPSDKSSPVLKLWTDASGVKHWKLKSESRLFVETYNFSRLMSRDRQLQGLWRSFPYDVSRCMVGYGEYIPIQCAGWQHEMEVPNGLIGFIQEGGCKLRSVANPFMAVQALGEPLKRKLEMVTGAVHQIGTFDQTACHTQIVEWLSEGLEVSSYDLSAFTDRFPFALQDCVLQHLKEEGIVSDFDVAVFKTVVDKSWTVPGHPNPVKWVVGQPLGFGPSFHLACLTHAALIRGMGGKKYVVVGDDVAIGDPVTSDKYKELISSIGVKIPPLKTIISKQFAEFCGKLVSPEGVNPSTKVKLITGADQLVRLIEFYGLRVLSHLSETERDWALKARLPRDLGGLEMQERDQTYAEWILTLHTDRIAESRLQSDLREALGSSYEAWPELYEWLLEFDSNNGLIQSDTVGLSGLSPKGVTGISASNLFTHGRVEEKSIVERGKTLYDLMDTSARQLLATRLPRLPDWLKHQYFDQFGYIERQRGNEIKLNTTLTWRTYHDAKRQDSFKRYLRKETGKTAKSRGSEQD